MNSNSFYKHHRKECKRFVFINNLDAVVRKYTAFLSFREMVFSALESDYRPTLYVHAAQDERERRALRFIADYYDRAMACMREERRAYRC